MKQFMIAATVAAMFLGTTAFAGDNKTNSASTSKTTTENVLQSARKGKMHKKHHAKHHAKTMKHDAPVKATETKKAPAKK